MKLGEFFHRERPKLAGKKKDASTAASTRSSQSSSSSRFSFRRKRDTQKEKEKTTTARNHQSEKEEIQASLKKYDDIGDSGIAAVTTNQEAESLQPLEHTEEVNPVAAENTTEQRKDSIAALKERIQKESARLERKRSSLNQNTAAASKPEHVDVLNSTKEAEMVNPANMARIDQPEKVSHGGSKERMRKEAARMDKKRLALNQTYPPNSNPDQLIIWRPIAPVSRTPLQMRRAAQEEKRKMILSMQQSMHSQLGKSDRKETKGDPRTHPTPVPDNLNLTSIQRKREALAKKRAEMTARFLVASTGKQPTNEKENKGWEGKKSKADATEEEAHAPAVSLSVINNNLPNRIQSNSQNSGTNKPKSRSIDDFDAVESQVKRQNSGVTLGDASLQDPSSAGSSTGSQEPSDVGVMLDFSANSQRSTLIFEDQDDDDEKAAPTSPALRSRNNSHSPPKLSRPIAGKRAQTKSSMTSFKNIDKKKTRRPRNKAAAGVTAKKPLGSGATYSDDADDEQSLKKTPETKREKPIVASLVVAGIGTVGVKSRTSENESEEGKVCAPAPSKAARFPQNVNPNDAADVDRATSETTRSLPQRKQRSSQSRSNTLVTTDSQRNTATISMDLSTEEKVRALLRKRYTLKNDKVHALHVAIMKGDLKTIETLVKIKPLLVDKASSIRGDTPLHYAVHYQSHSEEIFEALLRACPQGANTHSGPNGRFGPRKTPLLLAVERKAPLKVVSLLLEASVMTLD